jgi:hypothetical protein
MIVGISKLDASFKIHCDTTYQREKGLTMYCYKHFDLNRSFESAHI